MEKVYQEALTALIRHHKNNPDVYDEYGRWLGTRVWVQPCKISTEVTWKYVYLSNINGLIAKYNRRTGKIII